MAIPTIPVYTGGVANPDGSQDQQEFTTNMFNQLSYEAALAPSLNDTVNEMNTVAGQVDTNAAIAQNSADAAQAAANFEGEFVVGVTSAEKGKSYSYNSEVWLCLQNTTATPSKGASEWKLSVGEQYVTGAQEDLLPSGSEIFKGSNGEYLQVGDIVSSGTTHIRNLVSGDGKVMALTKVASGVVGVLTANSVEIDGVQQALIDAIVYSSDIPFVTSLGASEFDTGANNDIAFQESIDLFGEINIPPNVTLRTESGINLKSHNKFTMGGNSFIEPGSNNITVVNFSGDFANADIIRVTNNGGYTGCTALGFLPIQTLARVGQRYNKVGYIYIDDLHTGVAFQCGDFLTTDFASGCWYNEILGGEIRNCNIDIHFRPGLRTDPLQTNPPATSNRNLIMRVSSHFTKERGIYIESGEGNSFRDVWVESTIKTGAPVVAFEILEEQPGGAPNPNERNTLDGCGTESVGISIKNYNKFTRITNWIGERHDEDEYGNALHIDGRDPSRAPQATPYSYLQNFSFDSRFEVGKYNLFTAKGVTYFSGDRETPTEVGPNFKVNDYNFEWQDFDLSSALTNATLVQGVAKYKKVANVVTVLIRCRFDWVSGDVTITLPHPSTSDYSSSTGGSAFAWPVMVSKGGIIENGLALHLSTTIVRINPPAAGWDASNNDFHLQITYEA